MSQTFTTADALADYAQRQGILVERALYQAAVDAGYRGRQAVDRAAALHRVYLSYADGYESLPAWVKDYLLRRCEHHAAD